MLETTFEETARFHGHVCPGLAIGFRMTQAALKQLEAERAEDEDLVAVVENDACGVDAVQYLSGCTFGKGNLIHHDYGKQVYIFFHRGGGLAVRVSARNVPDAPQDRAGRIQWLLTAPEEQLVEKLTFRSAAPERARVRASVICSFCGERLMETRARVRDGQICCIPCSAEHQESLSRLERAGDRS